MKKKIIKIKHSYSIELKMMYFLKNEIIDDKVFKQS